MSTPTIYTVEQAADRMLLSRAQVFTLLRTKELGSYKIGRCRRISETHIEQYLATVESPRPDHAA
jgi:excisionase family DNA binding protein